MDANEIAGIDHDLILCGISGGKDSTALALWLALESGIERDKIRFQFMDTGIEDPLTYAFIDHLQTKIGNIETIRPALDFIELAKKKRRFPSTRARFCTQHLKIIPSHHALSAEVEAGRKIIKCVGSRHEEGTATNGRGELPAVSYESIGSDDDPIIFPIWFAIREMTIDQVWDVHRRHLSTDEIAGLIEADPEMDSENKRVLIDLVNWRGIPRNPLYDMGAARVGCFPCINSRKSEIRSMALYRPERIDLIEKWENEVGEYSDFGYSSFFNRGLAPPRFWDRPLNYKGAPWIDPETGEQGRALSIRAAVDWSRTKWGGKQYGFDWLDAGEMAGGVCEIGHDCE